MQLVIVSVLVCVSACLALDYSLGPDIPDSQYDDNTLEKETGEDTMEYMDNLKEELDASITPLSDMSISSLSCDITQENSTQTTEMDPYDYIKMRTSAKPPEGVSSSPTFKRPRGRKRGDGRQRSTSISSALKGVPKKRMKWDNSMNKFIMFTYYYVTKVETENKQYRRKMKEKFLQAYPDWSSITAQRLADQKRSIMQNRLLDIKTLREIKKSAKKQLEEEGVVLQAVVEDSKDKSFYD